MMSSNSARFISNPFQLGGIRTGTLDFPQPQGAQSTRVAFIDTGSGLRFTVSLDRGCDIVDAVYKDCALGYLTPNGLMGRAGQQTGMQWLRSWAGGLMTTCGATNIGGPQEDRAWAEGLHGRHNSLPASILEIKNPNLRGDLGHTDCAREDGVKSKQNGAHGEGGKTEQNMRADAGRNDAQTVREESGDLGGDGNGLGGGGHNLRESGEIHGSASDCAANGYGVGLAGDRLMMLRAKVCDTRMFGPSVEVERAIMCELGSSQIIVRDRVTNVGNEVVPHHWLYHCNMGYPLLSPLDSELVLSGRVVKRWGTVENLPEIDDIKRVTDVRSDHAGSGEGGMIIEPAGETAVVGVVNSARGIGLRMEFPTVALRRLAVWQHFGEGSYVCGIEPFTGSLWHDDYETEEAKRWWLEAGESRDYELKFSVVEGDDELAKLRGCDAALSE
ncbi:DUF4432 family protein [Planctomycetota bacterium]|nr:DUF4432 family protein [Planctomycetota bacterium]